MVDVERLYWKDYEDDNEVVILVFRMKCFNFIYDILKWERIAQMESKSFFIIKWYETSVISGAPFDQFHSKNECDTFCTFIHN